MEIATLDIMGTHKDDVSCPMLISQHPHGHVYCIDCGAQIRTKNILVKELVKDLTTGHGETFQISGRGTVMTIDLDLIPEVNSVSINDEVRIKGKDYLVRGIERQGGNTRQFGILVRALPG